MIAWAVTDLPEPDSPSTASVSPSRRSKVTPLIALATPYAGAELHLQVIDLQQQPVRRLPDAARSSSVSTVVRCRAMSASSAQLRVEGVADRVAQHDEGQHRRDKKTLGKISMCGAARISPMPEASEISMPHEMAGGCRPMPRNDRRRLDGDEGAEVDGRHDDHRGQRVGQDVGADDPAG